MRDRHVVVSKKMNKIILLTVEHSYIRREWFYEMHANRESR